jgi:predicted Mrr-cat superfamily restriction endonuclease
MKVDFVNPGPPQDIWAEEIGFIHENGALVLAPTSVDQTIVIGGVHGTYQTDDEHYFYWRGKATRILYRGDKVEITF